MVRKHLHSLSIAIAGLGAAAALGASVANAGDTTTTTTTTTTYPTGQMTIVSEQQRTFRVGDTQVVYTAPPTVDLSALNGSAVRVEVEPATGRVSKVTKVETIRTIE